MTEENKEAPDFLMEASKTEEKEVCDLERLAVMCNSYTEADNKVADFEKKMKEAKAERTRISQEVIPEFLNKYSISEIKLSDGRKVSVKDDISVTVKDITLFHNWLKTRKEDHFIKFTVYFEKMEPEKREKLFGFFLEQDYDCESEEKVHSATQKKYFKELLGVGKEPEEIEDGIGNGKMVLPEKIEAFAKIFKFQTTAVKESKKKI